MGATVAALNQIMQEFPSVFSGPQFFSFQGVLFLNFFFSWCLPKVLIFVESSSKNSSAVWKRNVVSEVTERNFVSKNNLALLTVLKNKATELGFSQQLYFQKWQEKLIFVPTDSSSVSVSCTHQKPFAAPNWMQHSLGCEIRWILSGHWGLLGNLHPLQDKERLPACHQSRC